MLPLVPHFSEGERIGSMTARYQGFEKAARHLQIEVHVPLRIFQDLCHGCLPTMVPNYGRSYTVKRSGIAALSGLPTCWDSLHAAAQTATDSGSLSHRLLRSKQ